MTICKKCLHGVVCRASDDSTKVCTHFKDSSRYIELPCKVGDTVYYLTTVDTEKELNVAEIFCGTVTSVSVDKGNTWVSVKYKNGLYYCHKSKEFGKTVFLTKEDAEKALKERQNNEKL